MSYKETELFLKKFAQSIGGEFDYIIEEIDNLQGSENHFCFIETTYKKHKIVLYGSNGYPPYFGVHLLVNDIGIQCNLSKKDVVNTIMSFITKKAVKIGNDEFDNGFHLETNNLDFAKRLLSDRVIIEVMKVTVQTGIVFEIKVSNFSYSFMEKYIVPSYTVCFSTNEWIYDEKILSGFYQALHKIADKLIGLKII